MNSNEIKVQKGQSKGGDRTHKEGMTRTRRREKKKRRSQNWANGRAASSSKSYTAFDSFVRVKWAGRGREGGRDGRRERRRRRSEASKQSQRLFARQQPHEQTGSRSGQENTRDETFSQILVNVSSTIQPWLTALIIYSYFITSHVCRTFHSNLNPLSAKSASIDTVETDVII